jgi:serine/threonine-protein kinase
VTEAEESLAVDRPTEPGSADTTPAIGVATPVCAACEKSNHPGVARCVFCGEPMGAGHASTARARWTAGPESGRDETFDSEPPPSRREPLLSVAESDLGPPVADPLIGVVVAERYRILEPLGRGGMGIVYKVEHTRIGKLLAMKLLTGELSRNPEVVRRFKHEALTSSKLSSPNTVQVFDFGVSDGLTYLVMELVAGEDLGRALRSLGPIPFGRLGRILVQVCSSLAEAHQKGIVHRDVKPENVMLLRARDGTDLAKVLDFGLAKLREGSDLNDVTSQGAIVGTPYFMAPEQVRGEAVDARTDIYAVGGLMYRALTGHYPFNGPTPMAVFTKHLTELPVPPSARAPEQGIPEGASRIVMKALAKSPGDRYQRIEDLQAALVDEIRALGESVDTLLDSGAVRKLAKGSGHVVEAAVTGVAEVPVEIATRDEVEAYERKLRRNRYGALGLAVAVLFAGSAVGTRVLLEPRAFAGVEREPNDAAAQATPIPLGKTVSAYLGKRIDANTSDRDFFAFEVPPSSPGTVRLSTSALPNMPMCTLLYRQGLATPLAQYCVGRPGRDLVIPALRLGPGRYMATVLEDRDPYGGAVAPFVFENVSDPYRFEVTPIDSPDASREIEPNDQTGSANMIAVGGHWVGTLGWAHDEDVVCVAGDAPGARFRVKDVIRPAGTVLEVTPLQDGEEGAPIRVHTSGKGPASAADVMAPWLGPALEASDAHCLRLRLATDPWIVGSNVVPSGGPEEVSVEVVAP